MITGTVVNSAAIIAGSVAGLAFGKRLGESVKDSVVKVVGLAVAVLGIKMAFEDHDFFPVIVSLVIGTVIGELLNIEGRLEQLGETLRKAIKSKSENFVNGFVTASVIYCVGSFAILGSIKDGLMNDPSLLYVKSLLDGIISVILASTLGIGVIFSAASVFIYQGILSLLAFNLRFLLSEPMYVSAISVTGGVIILSIGIGLSGIARFRTANMLPAIFITPVYDYLTLILS
ncbi:DUF554 domain-containing protein [Geovibrio thiophilus]|uniref:DUF554 domain-containing protein n=1 Tax=Geovibrio thiophilus TaxID=139438 RepID=A0A410JXT2_9BACT|nr:DUF554 domain-containing protein [Geovibrio thiophilus]QAR32851.1 DUF554 domain-containing protein [Geovibrio thiophilus]